MHFGGKLSALGDFSKCVFLLGNFSPQKNIGVIGDEYPTRFRTS
jgi:hypothetical protein